MRHWRLLLISIFIIAILTTSSFAAIRTVTYTSQLYTGSTPQGKLVDWTDNHTLPYFNPALGRLISVDFRATLNATLNGYAQNQAGEPVPKAYMAVDTNMSVAIINGKLLPLKVRLRIPNDPSAYIYVGPYPGNFSGSDANETWGPVFYNDAANLTNYTGTGTFKLKTVTKGQSDVAGGGSWTTSILTRAWSYASITYTYDDARCLSGYKLDGCTGLPLSGWNITVSNATSISIPN
jgi:hypothetical protein